MCLGIEIDLFFVQGIEISVRAEIHLFWLWWSIDLVLCGWWWSNFTRFWDAGRKSLGFSVSIEIDLVFVGLVDIDLISVWGIELDIISF